VNDLVCEGESLLLDERETVLRSNEDKHVIVVHDFRSSDAAQPDQSISSVRHTSVIVTDSNFQEVLSYLDT
jgi:hypothetical protein